MSTCNTNVNQTIQQSFNNYTHWIKWWCRRCSPWTALCWISICGNNFTKEEALLNALNNGRPRKTGTIWTSSSHIITTEIGSGVLLLAWASVIGLDYRSYSDDPFQPHHFVYLMDVNWMLSLWWSSFWEEKLYSVQQDIQLQFLLVWWKWKDQRPSAM